MDSGIADTINRLVAQKVTAHLDQIDARLMPLDARPWFAAPIGDTLIGTGPATNADRAWMIGHLAARTPDLSFDGVPADYDWENLFSHFRAEVEARRDPSAHPVRAAEIPVPDGVGSR
jgi:hypothetical protein